jgi:uncharacterized integral membrane protein
MSRLMTTWLPFILLMCACFLAAGNGADTVLFHLTDTTSATLGVGTVFLLAFLFGCVTSALACFGIIAQLKKVVQANQLKTEQSQVSREESDDSVRALQAKVDTLEAALKKALATPTS